MHLSSSLKSKYTSEQLSAREAQRLAEFIAWGPAIFEASRLMLKYGVLDLLRDHDEGLTRQEIAEQCHLSDYAAKCLLEASLSIGTVLVNPDNDRYMLSKTGWFLLTDPATRVNIDFNHDVNYEGWSRRHLDESVSRLLQHAADCEHPQAGEGLHDAQLAHLHHGNPLGPAEI